MPQGYNIDCDAGSLYYRNCYIIDASGARNEIIGYTHNGDPVTKSATSAAGATLQGRQYPIRIPQLYTLHKC